ncbi:MAG: sodium:solute symporter family protein [Chloroflexota bacterium]|nr:sodium:solute symporter family protein [Chloroflexota bacterium]
MLFLVIIVVYFIAMIAIGAVSKRSARGADNFFVAGRRQSPLFVTGSLVATIIGGSATIGLAGLGFTRGLTGIWWLLVGSIGLVVLGLFLVKKVREFGLYTLPEIVEKQYGSRVALAASILIVVAWLGVIAGQIVAAGKILSVMGIGTPLLWMTVFTAVFVTYVILGGQHAVIGTDFAQAILIFVGIFAGLAVMLSALGGWAGLSAGLAPAKFAFPTGPGFATVDLISLLLLVGLTYVVGPDMYSRVFCARDVKTARTSVFWSAALIVPFALAITLFGMGAAVLFPKISAEQAFPMIITGVLPPVLGGLVMAALVAAVMSSADTCLLSASTILSVDIIGRLKPSLSQEKIVRISRWAVLVLGIASLALALFLKGVISALLFAYTIYTSGVILPVLAGFYKDRLKVTPLAALVAIIGGGLTGLASKLLGIKYLDLGGLLISALLLFAVSVIENRMRGRAIDVLPDIQ